MTSGLRQIVPALPPQHEGVGGYAVALASELRTVGVETEFLCPAPADVDFAVGSWPPRPSQVPTLVHYVNYGYHPHGVPRGLVGSWVKARSTGRPSSLFVFFHEIYATAWPWRRTFWTSPVQRLVARRLARASDQAFTTLLAYESVLARLAPRLPVRRMAMPSPVGEPNLATPPSRRSDRLVVFGGPGNRAAAYKLLALAGSALDAAQISSIVDVGPNSIAPSGVLGRPVTARGVLHDSELSALLSDCRLALLSYPADFLGKSTVFAAYAAHGVPCLVPVRPKFGRIEAPCIRDEALTEAMLDNTSGGAFAWYQTHRLSVHAEAISAALVGRD